ncbi:head-tail connector protein [Acinetobacter johnsonii]|uniref:head-tail connector protein n=1 Tax=Acinetobacter johnsonii TaxID=40214 RepID=UPI003CE7D096
MSQFLTKEQVKLNLRIDHDEEDVLIESLIKAAFDAFEQSTNRKLYEVDAVIPEDVENGIIVTDSILQGAYMLIGHWYANRETAVVGTITAVLPLATDWLWKRHRWVNV